MFGFQRLMPQFKSPHDLFAHTYGREMVLSAKKRSAQMLAPRYYPLAVQLGLPARVNFLTGLNARKKIHLEKYNIKSTDGRFSVQNTSLKNKVYADFNQLPFCQNYVDLMILPFVLEFSDAPSILKEASQCLSDDGLMMIIGMNPISMIGGWHSLREKLNNNDHRRHFHSIHHLRKQLNDMDMEIRGSRYFYYMPPIKNNVLRQKFSFLEKAGDRWWPMCSAGYILLAGKKESLKLSQSVKFKKQKNKLNDLGHSMLKENKDS